MKKTKNEQKPPAQDISFTNTINTSYFRFFWQIRVFEILPISLSQEPFIFFGNVICYKAPASRQHTLFKSKKADHATVLRPAGHAGWTEL